MVKELVVKTTLTVNGQIVSKGKVPTAKIGKALEAVDENYSGEIEIDGTDTAGTIRITIKDTFGGSGEEYELGIITFSEEYETTPRFALTPLNGSSVNAPVYIKKYKDKFILVATGKLDKNTEYQFDYLIIGSQPLAENPTTNQ